MDSVRDKLALPEAKSGEGTDGAAASPGSQLRHEDENMSDVAASDDRESQPRRWEVNMDMEIGPATIPASIVSEVVSPDIKPRPTGSPDIISQGQITLEQAQMLFDVYTKRLDHYLYSILPDRPTLDHIRTDSPLLTAAICTVAALHSSELGHLYGKCYRKYVDLCSAQSLSKESNLNDIRGLCIGAFWLHELSWQLVGLGKLSFTYYCFGNKLIYTMKAVRISIESHLHRSIHKALRNDKNAYLQTRLYYLVYVCDHHFSIAYGRPPMSRECESIKATSQFLRTENAVEDDHRLVSQVQIWSTASGVSETFGIDVDAPVGLELVPKFRRYMIQFDTWRADWNEAFGHHIHVGNYPQKGVGLHYHFAKLYLCSHAFRGASIPANAVHSGKACGYKLSPELDEIAHVAVFCAMSILRTITLDAEIQSHLNGLPLYFDTMIAFAVVFLLKVATKYNFAVQVDSKELLTQVEDTVRTLRIITQKMHRRHLLVTIADGVEKLLHRCTEPSRTPSLPEAAIPVPGAHGVGTSSATGPSVTGQQMLRAGAPPSIAQTQGQQQIAPADTGFDWTNYDFLASDDPMVWPEQYPLDFTFPQQ
jgi:hypothetical protein